MVFDVPEIRVYEARDYRFTAKVVRWIDGDTVELSVILSHFSMDLGFGVVQSTPYTELTLIVRLDGIDTPEMRGKEREAGIVSKNYVEKMVPPDEYCVLETRKTPKRWQGKFGRWLGRIWYIDESGQNRCLNDDLVKMGLAVEKKWD